MTADPVRIGLVGFGRGGQYFHAPLIAAAAGCSLAGVVTRSPERRRALAATHPGVPAYDDVDTLLAAGVDALAVSTPLSTHVPLVRTAIQRGVPVVCDKPFAADAATARETVEAARAAGVLLTVYQNRRYDADFRTVQRVVASGVLGDVDVFESRMEQEPPAGGYADTGGGVRLDFGTHVVDQALHLFGPAESVVAEAHTVEEPPGFDARFFVLLRHQSGVSSRITTDWALHGGAGPRFRVTGTAATLVLATDDDGQSARLLSGRTPADDPEFGTVPVERWGRLHRRGRPDEAVPAERGAWTAFYAAFAGAVRGDGPVPVDPADAVAALEVLDAARVSAESGQEVRLSA